MTPEQSQQAMLDYAHSKGLKDDLSNVEPTPADAAVPAPPAAAAPAAEAPKPAAEADKPAGAGAPGTEEHTYSFEEDGFVGARDFAAQLDANPALKAALPQNMRDQILANARLAERGAEYAKMFASPREAQIVMKTAQDYASLSQAFNQVNSDVEAGTTSLVQKLIEASAIHGPDGKLVKDANGNLRTDGTAGKFLSKIGERWAALNIVNKVKEIADPELRENVQAALDLVMESVGLRPSTAKTNDQADPALTARKAELDAQEARIRSDREAETTRQQTEYNSALKGDLASLYESEVGRMLDLATGLDAFARKAADDQIAQAFQEAIRSNVAYQQDKREIRRQAPSAERRAAEVKLARDFTRENLARIARPILAKAGVTTLKKVQQRASAEAARAENVRSEINGGSTRTPGAQPGAVLSPQQQYNAAKDAWKAANPGLEPRDEDVTQYMMLQYAESKGLRSVA
jgi:hypothetical protein